jgi:hypothetical protein
MELELDHSPLTLSKILAIQKLFRGFVQRARFRKSRVTYATKKSKYFRINESKETINPKNQLATKIVTKDHTYTTGAIYSGEWLGGLRHGCGSMKWPDGAQYHGQWSYNAAHGTGTFTFADGDQYCGNWRNNMCHGQGSYLNSKNTGKFSGNWLDDQQHGLGSEEWPNEAKFEGLYLKGQKQGFGKYHWIDGSSYYGHWENNQ